MSSVAEIDARSSSVRVGRPGPGQVRVRLGALSLNGRDAAGTIDAVGSETNGFVVGDRVAYQTSGAAMERVVIEEDALLGIPRGVSDEQAAALLSKGLGVRMLVKEAHPVVGGETILVHGATSVVGAMTTAWAKALGATVIAAVGSRSGRAAALRCGADSVVVFGEEDVAASVRELTGGTGVDVVYDGVGSAAFSASIDSVKDGGTLVLHGPYSQSPVDARVLVSRGIKIVRPNLSQYLHSGAAQQGAADLFLAIRSGLFDGMTITSFALHEAERVRADVARGRVTGSVVLLPASSDVKLAA